MFPAGRRLQCRNLKVLKPKVAAVRIFVTDIDMEDADGAGSHLPAVDDLSHDETEGSGSSEESDVFDVRRREDEPWSETASSSEDGHDDEEGGVIEAANDALLMELDADAVTASETSSSPFRRFEEETAKVVNMLRRNPLLPEGVSADAAVRVSGMYCGFAGCDAVGPSAKWVVDHPGKLPRDWLAQHIHHTHLEDLRGMFVAAERCVSASPTTCVLCDVKFQERFIELYTHALHTAQERSIPDVGSTVDRCGATSMDSRRSTTSRLRLVTRARTRTTTKTSLASQH